MKVKLIVVQGKPEGMTIPLTGPTFRIGRGETCHLRPSSEAVSREHAEFTLTPGGVSVADLGSRNGTLVNGRAITSSQPLKNGDLVQVGPLTFAVTIEGAAAPAPAAPKVTPSSTAAPVKTAPTKTAAAPSPTSASLDDVSNDEIDAWLVADKQKPVPESPSGVYGGDTITISAFKDAASIPKPLPPTAPTPPPLEDSDEEFERHDEDETEDEDEADDPEVAEEEPEDFIDESNPFYVKKKKPEEAAAPVSGKQTFKDTSDAATEILKKMMEKRRQK